ncbi:MAG: glucose-6-phosphate isomerase [Opitutales bacterium]
MTWTHFNQHYLPLQALDFAIDTSRMDFGANFFSEMEPRMQGAFEAMQALEAGAIANPDENRMVGHYWLRAPERAPDADITAAIKTCLEQIRSIAADVHNGSLQGAEGPFRNLLVIGIGGSALGPQFVADALGGPELDRLQPHFFDNTDPDGMDRTLAQLEGRLGRTLAVVISKSGGTPETRNGMLEAEAAYKAAGLDFARHAIAVTGEGSKLDQQAEAQDWLARLPMWDWVGGRTSELAAVGLLPAALQGIDIDRMLAGAAAMDEATRTTKTAENPAALLALAWYHATDGRGAKDMVVLPYKDRLALFSKYLQQLLMESLGKEKDLDGNTVNQGLTVYGNKGSTDQHAYVQQLREGVRNFFVTFIEVLEKRAGDSIFVENESTTGDFLEGFFLGTREALYENGRQSITLTVGELNPEAIGGLIALFERAVGLYASLININAYHQPGVEAGKKAAVSILDIQRRILEYLHQSNGELLTATTIAKNLDLESKSEIIFKLLVHLSANQRGIGLQAGASPEQYQFYNKKSSR